MSSRKSFSHYWNQVIQPTLFKELEQEIGALSPLHKKLTSVLEIIRIEDFIACARFKNGRTPKHRAAIARAYIAKIIFKFTYTNQLIDYLKVDKQLRLICGFNNFEKIPSKSKFSRAFNEFALKSLPENAQQSLVKEFTSDEIQGHATIDSTPLETREKPLKKGTAEERKKRKSMKNASKRKGELNSRQKQLKEENLEKALSDLSKLCDKGMKRSAQGYTQIWKGYKLHVSINDDCIPLATVITSASVNDCEVAIPLIRKSNTVAKNLYYLMDAAYDHPEIKELCTSTERVALIDKCPTGVSQKIEKEAEKQRRKILNIQTAEEKRYSERFPKERFNALYKDFHGGCSIFYKGYLKVSCHVMFGILTLTASTILSLIQ